MHNRHEARGYRAKDDADNRRTRASILRAVITKANNERTSRQWARMALFEPVVAPEEARAAPVEHSALPRWLGGHQSSISRFQNKFEQHLSSILRLRGTLERPFRASCGAGPGSSGYFASPLRLQARLEQPFREPAAALGQARAAISSLQLRPGPSGHFDPTAAPGQARCRKRRHVWCFRARQAPKSEARNSKPEL